MQLDDALQLARTFATRSLHPQPAMQARAAGSGGPVAHVLVPTRPVHLSFGAAVGRGRLGWKLAVRAWSERDLVHPSLSRLERATAGELDVRVTGPVKARRAPSLAALRGRRRPLRAGYSVAHHAVTAGTLGAFVSDANDQLYLLSNNHVLANTNAGRRGDVIVQPGPIDGGRRAHDRVGLLHRFVRLRGSGNRVDAALATIDADAEPAQVSLPGIGSVAGWWREAPETWDVRKIGRTTGLTRGRITALGLLEQEVDYDGRRMRFDDVIEVTGLDESEPFSDGGDSGSLVVDADRYAVGLLFAGDARTTYLNPIHLVLEAFDVGLVS